MPIAPQVPGVPTAVTPDTSPPIYTSTQGPAPDGLVVADDVLAVHQIALNIQQRILPYVPAARGSTLLFGAHGAATFVGATAWEKVVTATGQPYWSQRTNSTDKLIVPLYSMPPGVKIASFSAVFEGYTGHAAIPQFPPVVELCTTNYNTSSGVAMSVIDTVTDTTAVVADYQSPHTVTKTLASAYGPIVAGQVFYIRITGENGTNYVTGLQMISAAYTVTVA